VISNEEAGKVREQLMRVLAEDAHNAERLMRRLDSITRESGVGACSALLLILTHLPFDEDEARGHWEKILAHREQLSAALEREAGIRMAVLDYFVNVNRQLTRPTLIDLEMLDAAGQSAAQDRMSGLSTNRVFHVALQNELRRARRYQLKAAVVLFDFDEFARVNAELGKLVGDRLIREAALLLSNKIRDIDIAARPGEDELALLLPETDRNGALLVAERFRAEFERFFQQRESDGRPVGLTLSAGVACYPEDALTPEELLERAAQALYQAKATGKNTVQLYHPERRRYLRFELEPGRFEVEVLSPPDRGPAPLRNLSRNGILFVSAEALEVGEAIEIRLADGGDDPEIRPLRIRGRVVRLEELPEPAEPAEAAKGEKLAEDRFEIGVAFDLGWGEGIDDLLDFLEKARDRQIGRRS
jgi:diguanylate cyclase (GGDEF)-like protein